MTNTPRLGVMLMIAAALALAVQDGISRHLAGQYNVLMVVMIRYWFFAAFVIVISTRSASIRTVIRTRHPWLQTLRAVLLVAEICVAVWGFVKLGLTESQAIFACYPLLVVLLAGPILGERVTRRHWVAIGAGAVGVAVMLRPGSGMISPWAILPFASAFMFAMYGILTRYVARADSVQTSFFWTGTVGAIAMTAVGLSHWTPMTQADWGWMGALCLVGALAHFLLIKAYDVADTATIQPFAYFQLVFAAAIGISLFGETLTLPLVIGAVIVVGAGVMTLATGRDGRGDA